LLVLFAGLATVNVIDTLEIRIPDVVTPISGIVNRITNTTFGE
jgi:hypothetical protein